MPQSQLDREKLISGLQEDVLRASEEATKSEAARGVSLPQEEKTSFLPRALRTKNIVFGEAELKNLKSTMEDAINEILRTSSFKNEQEMFSARIELQKRMNKFTLGIMKDSAALEARLKQAGYDQAARQANINIYAGALKGISLGAIAAAGRPAIAAPTTTTAPVSPTAEQFEKPALLRS